MIRRWLVKAAALGLILALAPKPVSAQNRDDSTASPGLLAAINVEATKLATADKERSRYSQAASQSLQNRTRTSRTGSKARYGVAFGLLGVFAGSEIGKELGRFSHRRAQGELIGVAIGAAAGAALGVWLAGR
jgi:hypothetical protein